MAALNAAFLFAKLVVIANGIEGVMRICFVLFTSALMFAPMTSANAVSWSVQMNCASDYYAYCSKHVAGSAGCHACMRSNRPKLSNACVSALLDDGIIPRSDITRQKVKLALKEARPVQSLKVMPQARRIANDRAAAVAALARRSKAKTYAALDALSARRAQVARAPAPVAREVPQKSLPPALEIDQRTFEAFKNRAPYFVATEDVKASISAPE